METVKLNDIWNNIIKYTVDNLIKEDQIFSFEQIIGNSKLKEISDDKKSLMVVTESEFAKNIIESEFINQIKNGINQITSSDYDVTFFTNDDWKKWGKNESTEEFFTFKTQSDSLNPKYTLENFVPSQSNKMLYTAAMSVAIKPGKNWNPFFIYGGSGLGKTHLLHGIGNFAKTRNPNYSIRYIESKDFGSLVTKAAVSHQAGEQIENIKEEYIHYDMLLIDDIQFIQTMPKVKEIFFGIFSYFIEEGKQIVITSDQYPEELKDFEARFITRFKSGLLLSVLPPDIDTAKKILRMKINQREDFNINNFEDSALEFIAVNFGSSVRELEGALNRIILWTITNDDIDTVTLENLTEIFKGMYNKRHNVTTKRIIQSVGKYYGIPEAAIMSKARKADVMQARHIAIYFCRTMLDMNLISIGRLFGKDHTTIMNSIKKIDNERNKNNDLNIALFELRKIIVNN